MFEARSAAQCTAAYAKACVPAAAVARLSRRGGTWIAWLLLSVLEYCLKQYRLQLRTRF